MFAHACSPTHCSLHPLRHSIPCVAPSFARTAPLVVLRPPHPPLPLQDFLNTFQHLYQRRRGLERRPLQPQDERYAKWRERLKVRSLHPPHPHPGCCFPDPLHHTILVPPHHSPFLPMLGPRVASSAWSLTRSLTRVRPLTLLSRPSPSLTCPSAPLAPPLHSPLRSTRASVCALLTSRHS